MLRHTPLIVLSVGLLAGCAQSQPAVEGDSQLPTQANAADGGAAPDRRTERPTRPSANDVAHCDDFQASAQQLLADAQSCSSDDDCVVTDIQAPCLTPFLCPTAVNQTADLEQLQSEASRLSTAYRKCSNQCSIASCAGPPRAECDLSTKRCKLVLWGARAPAAQDAGTSSAASDADTDAGPAVDPRFQCTTSDDCAIKNVGNCCGYYPRCANADAEFAPPRCNGQSGVCGYPDITSCECRANTCVSLQDGHEV